MREEQQLEFSASFVCIAPAAQNEFDIAIQSAEVEYETEIDGDPQARMMDNGDLLISAASTADGSVVTVQIRSQHWEPLYNA